MSLTVTLYLRTTLLVITSMSLTVTLYLRTTLLVITRMSLTVTLHLRTTLLVITCIRQEDEIKVNKNKNDQTSLLVLMEPKSKQTEITKHYDNCDMCKAYKKL